jgi:hypothetical protein
LSLLRKARATFPPSCNPDFTNDLLGAFMTARDSPFEQFLSASASNGSVRTWKRVIGTIRRECLDHMTVFHQASLRLYE